MQSSTLQSANKRKSESKKVSASGSKSRVSRASSLSQTKTTKVVQRSNSPSPGQTNIYKRSKDSRSNSRSNSRANKQTKARPETTEIVKQEIKQQAVPANFRSIHDFDTVIPSIKSYLQPNFDL